MGSIRNSLLTKVLAILLFLACGGGAILGALGLVGLDQGYGSIGNTFYDDPLFIRPMEDAMHKALWLYTEEDYYYDYQLQESFPGFACLIYDGNDQTGFPVFSYGADFAFPGEAETTTSDVEFYILEPEDEQTAVSSAEPLAPPGYTLRRTLTASSTLAENDFYTVQGYLSSPLPYGSDLWFYQQVYNFLHPFADGSLILLTIVLTVGAVLCLVYLLCAAGHRRGYDTVMPNWQDLIPLDLYLCAAGCAVIAIGVFIEDMGGYPRVMLAFLLVSLGILGEALVCLATLLTLATRLKLGKWWRSTLIYKVLRWCWRLCRKCTGMVRDFFHLFPFTWRTVGIVMGILFVQLFLTLLSFESYNGGLFFLLLVIFDIFVIVTAAWLTSQLQQVKQMGKNLADGHLEAKVNASKMYFDIRTHAEHLNSIGVGLNRAVEQRMKSERLKTELITNVSHDIKTPLTSIVNYVDLLKKEDLPPSAGEYVAVLDRQANRLKKLTEDLVEASKASTGNVAVKLEPIVVNEIIHQAIGDYDEKLSAGRLEVIVNTYEGNVMALADGRLLWRVLDNLLSNVCKYALSGTRVYVDLTREDETVLLSMKNISRDQLNVSAGDLMERFVRGDTSRHTEGSGLGLNIARSLMELMGGTCQLSVDGDLFKATLTLRAVE